MGEFDIVQTAKQLWEMAPDEVKQAAPYFITCTGQMASTINIYHSDLKPLSQLCCNLRNGSCLDAKVANQLLDSCKNDLIAQNRDSIFGSLTNATNECHDTVINGLEKAIKGTANKILGFSAFSSFTCIVIEVIRLWNIWERVKDARNIVDTSINNRKSISESLAGIPGEINILNNYIVQMTAGNIGEINRVKTMRQIGKIRRMLDKLEKEIRDLEVEVGNRKVRLGEARCQAAVAAVTNIVTGVSTSVNLGLLASVASPFLVTINTAFAVSNFIIAAANIGVCYITKDDIKKIQNELHEIAELEKHRMSLQEEFDNKAQEAWDLMENQAEASGNVFIQ